MDIKKRWKKESSLKTVKLKKVKSKKYPKISGGRNGKNRNQS